MGYIQLRSNVYHVQWLDLVLPVFIMQVLLFLFHVVLVVEVLYRALISKVVWMDLQTVMCLILVISLYVRLVTLALHWTQWLSSVLTVQQSLLALLVCTIVLRLLISLAPLAREEWFLKLIDRHVLLLLKIVRFSNQLIFNFVPIVMQGLLLNWHLIFVLIVQHK